MTDKIEYVVKLTPAMMAEVSKAVSSGTINVHVGTTPIQAGYMLGVQAVLNVLRDGFVYDQS